MLCAIRSDLLSGHAAPVLLRSRVEWNLATAAKDGNHSRFECSKNKTRLLPMTLQKRFTVWEPMNTSTVAGSHTTVLMELKATSKRSHAPCAERERLFEDYYSSVSMYSDAVS